MFNAQHMIMNIEPKMEKKEFIFYHSNLKCCAMQLNTVLLSVGGFCTILASIYSIDLGLSAVSKTRTVGCSSLSTFTIGTTQTSHHESDKKRGEYKTRKSRKRRKY